MVLSFSTKIAILLWLCLSFVDLGCLWSRSFSSRKNDGTPCFVVPMASAFAPLEFGTLQKRGFLRAATANGDHTPNNENENHHAKAYPRRQRGRPRPTQPPPQSNDEHARAQLPSVTLSPLQVSYYPQYLDLAEEELNRSAYLQRPVSLHEALQRMRKALTRLREQTSSSSSSSPSSSPLISSFIRLEQVVHTDTTDPLAWLDAQVARNHPFSSKHSVIEDAPIFYFGNQEGSAEAAVLGSVLTVNATNKAWEYMSSLPRQSRWYGGEPFDAESPRRGPWEAWQPGSAWWILPALEIRREDHGVTILSIHVHHYTMDHVQALLDAVDAGQSSRRAPTTLPPILSRDGHLPDAVEGGIEPIFRDGQDLYEQAVQTALTKFDEDHLQKVVLARPQQLHFGVPLAASHLLRRWKYGGHEGGHLFWMRPGKSSDGFKNEPSPDFLGCTPERLFRVQENRVSTEALAGTRPRGTTAVADAQLCQDLFDSPKDMAENRLTGDFILNRLRQMEAQGWVSMPLTDASQQTSVFVRRLRHLQHICHSYAADIVDPALAQNVTRFLLENMHPTPAVCGVPTEKARQFIREFESIGFDRGFYSGPVGYLGREQSDLVVALRSGVIQRRDTRYQESTKPKSTLTLYAGAGIVPGSTVKGEWAETNYKLAVVASLFPQSPFSLQGSLTPNSAWASALVEELIRNGITQFYICPGSRSTPLVVAISKALRSHLGIVHADSVHDERAAAFRALGYARGGGKPAAVVTSSGTAVANLYPALVEASMDGVPMLLLTADRPYESRSTGANQAIDQVGIFSSSYIRWSRDIPPPSDEVPISLVLSDVDHAVDVARRSRGPVHLNIQFRENLAPDAGRIRNDDRIDAVTKFNACHFTSSPKFERWSITGDRFTNLFSASTVASDGPSLEEIVGLIESSKRAIIVVGNVRPSVSSDEEGTLLEVMDRISEFAAHVGFPILAGVQSAALRFRSASVVPFAEHLLRSSVIRENLKPDLIIQIGAPLLSTEIPQVIRSAIANDENANHVLIHPHSFDERFDPDFTVTHRVSTDILPYLMKLQENIANPPTSEIVTLIPLGRRLQSEMKDIVHESVAAVTGGSGLSLSEPELTLSLAESIENSRRYAIFLSNSMPIRDAEAFLYPLSEVNPSDAAIDLSVVGTSRGASGIDGIIATAKGLAEFSERPTTLLIGDVSALHDISSLHALANDVQSLKKNPGKKIFPLTTVVVNNDGGGIFSFLPIASYGSDVNFDEFFGTPTSSFDFEKGAKAFGVPSQVVDNIDSFNGCYENALKNNQHNLIEARVTKRDVNVRVHREITSRTNDLLSSLLKKSRKIRLAEPKLYFREFRPPSHESKLGRSARRTLLLLHGWMGDSLEWQEVTRSLSDKLSSEWSILALDLPGHGLSGIEQSSELHDIRQSLGLAEDSTSEDVSVEGLARSILSCLSDGVQCIDAVAGYSLGGRVALAMNDLTNGGEFSDILRNNTKLILLGAHPRVLLLPHSILTGDELSRLRRDDDLSEEILRTSRYSIAKGVCSEDSHFIWSDLVDRWYDASIWGGLKQRDEYDSLRKRRSQSLQRRARSLATIVSGCSPLRDYPTTKPYISGPDTLFIAGAEDEKYSLAGERLSNECAVSFCRVPGCGHGLLTDSPETVADIISDYLMSQSVLDTDSKAADANDVPVDEVPIYEPLSGVSEKSRDTQPSFDFIPFTIDLVDQTTSSPIQSGIGWGENASVNKTHSTRSGVLIEARTTDGLGTALGEASPLEGVHPESFAEALSTIDQIDQFVMSEKLVLSDFDCLDLLKLDGYFSNFSAHLDTQIGKSSQYRSVFSALEMVLLGLASQKSGVPVLQAIARSRQIPMSSLKNTISLNGLILRGDSAAKSTGSRWSDNMRAFSSLKVKVGHRDIGKDMKAISDAFERNDFQLGRYQANVRLDANRAWDESEALLFVAALEGVDTRSFDRIEFIEEPLKKVDGDLSLQVECLERFYRRGGLRYALDESLADLAAQCDYDFPRMKRTLVDIFRTSRGCAAFVLKPSLLGLELSMQIASLARTELQIGAVFTSCFESGVALAYTAFLAAVSDSLDSKAPLYSHGLGTFEMLSEDTLVPSFASHVDDFGRLNVASLSRSLFGLSLQEIQEGNEPRPSRKKDETTPHSAMTSSSASGATSKEQSDAETSFAVSLDLPFSSEIAHARFTDLPQQPRWSPWVTSVAYQGTQETEWKLNVRGISLQWRATSKVLHDPWLAIEWESVSGLSNHGIVEFIPINENACEMRVRLTTRPPRILRPLFRGASIFLEDFIRDKLLKWSLEMFRDVVKADLALERGDVELGDALFSAVAGKAVAIEAALKSAPSSFRRSPRTSEESSVDE